MSEILREEYDERFVVSATGTLARPGLYRQPNDPEAIHYAKSIIEPGDEQCIFCPDNIINLTEQEFVSGYGATVAARPPYGHFLGYQVEEHRMIIPSEHTEALWDLNRFDLHRLIGLVASQQVEAEAEANGDGSWIPFYTRSPDSLAKSIPHVHSHIPLMSRKAISRLEYSIDLNKGGVLRLDFKDNDPANEQVIGSFFGASADQQPSQSECTSEAPEGFEITNSSSPWTHFDGHKVLSHEVLTMTDREKPFSSMTPRQLEEYYQYLKYRNQERWEKGNEAKRTFTQDVFLGRLGASGCRASLLELDYSAISYMDLRGGHQHLRFVEPTDGQIAQINQRQWSRK